MQPSKIIEVPHEAYMCAASAAEESEGCKVYKDVEVGGIVYYFEGTCEIGIEREPEVGYVGVAYVRADIECTAYDHEDNEYQTNFSNRELESYIL